MIQLKNQYEMAVWMVAVHATLSGRNAVTPAVTQEAANGADMLVGMFRLRAEMVVAPSPPAHERETQPAIATPHIVVDPDKDAAQ
jgi:hypothetical protein